MEKVEDTIMEQTEAKTGVLDLIGCAISCLFASIEFERQLWILKIQARRLIRWASQYPNDHNLGNLILFRHQLRQMLCRIDVQAESVNVPAFTQKSMQRLLSTTQSIIERLEMAIAQTEEALK